VTEEKLSVYDKTEVIDISNIMQIYGYNHITITIKKKCKGNGSSFSVLSEYDNFSPLKHSSTSLLQTLEVL